MSDTEGSVLVSIILADSMMLTCLHQNKVIHRQFHTSSPRHVHPFIWVFLKPVLKIIPWIAGKYEMNWDDFCEKKQNNIYIM